MLTHILIPCEHALVPHTCDDKVGPDPAKEAEAALAPALFCRVLYHIGLSSSFAAQTAVNPFSDSASDCFSA